MKKALIILGLAAALAGVGRAQTSTVQGYCQTGGVKVQTQGVNSTTLVQASYPNCTVTVYQTGTGTLATLSSSAGGAPLSNPFVAPANGLWRFWASTSACYDVILTGGVPLALPSPQTLTDVCGGGGGGGSPLTTKGDIEGFSTVPARIPVGLDGQVLTADSTQVLGVKYATPASGAVSSVSNSDGSLTVTPTTGAVVGSLNTAHANTWTGTQTFSGPGSFRVPVNLAPVFASAFTAFGSDSAGNLLLDKNGTAAEVCDTNNGACGSGGTNPTTCTTSTATSICITDSIYDASGFGATTTTVSGTFTAGTSGTIASCSTFLPNNGIAIVGAGSAGGLYIGKVVSCAAGALVVTPATSTSVSSSNVVQHDETAAINLAIAALGATNGGGDIWFPTLATGAAALYLVNGPLQDTGGSNAILPLPVIPNYSANFVRIGMKGLQSVSLNGPPTQGGAIIQTSANSGNLIAGYDAATGGGFPPLTNVWLDIANLTLVAGDNPGIVMVNCRNCQAMTAAHLLIEAGPSYPTNTAGGGLYYPSLANAVRISVDDIAEGGFYTGFILGEHSQTGRIDAANSHTCFVLDAGSNSGVGATYHGNSLSVDYMWAQDCTDEIAAGSNYTVVNIQNADMEQVKRYGVNDPTGLLHGVINFYVPAPSFNTSYCNANPNGAANVLLNPIYCRANSAIASPRDYWKSQEGSGTTLLNSGDDSSNTMTTTAVTWATASGFSGTVATYNGTSSYAVASSAASTSFTNTQPFSACAWFVSGTSAPSTFLLSNLQTAIGAAPGWRIGLFSGQLDIYLISNVGTSNYIHVQTPSGLVAAGDLHQVCMTYSGSSAASGITLYDNGAQVSYSVVTDNLTGSTASTTPLYIGSEADFSRFFNGSIGQVAVWPSALTASVVASLYSNGPTSIPFPSNCTSAASPAVCGSAAAGSVAIAAAGTTLVVDTTAVTANSQILITADASLGTRLGVTCDTTAPSAGPFRVDARTPGTSFTITDTNPDGAGISCLSYTITN